MKRIFLAAVIATATPAQAQGKPLFSLYGMTIMQPMSLPECSADLKAVERYRKAKAKYPNLGLRYPYGVNKTGPCYQRSDKFAGTPSAPANESLTIDFPFSAPAENAKYSSIYAVIIDGKVQGIGFMSFGISDQDVVMDMLRGKFGEPTTNQIISKQNGYGAKFDSIEAGWSLGEGTMLFFEGTGTRTDYGTVMLQTAVARQQYLESMKKITSGTPM